MILFSVPGANKPKINTKYVCPTCQTKYGTFYGKRRLCDTCNGFGQDPEDKPLGEFALYMDPFEATTVLHDLLNYGCEEKPLEGGTLEPSDVQIQLALADFRIEQIVNPIFVSEEDDPIRQFLPTEKRLRDIADALGRFAEKALEEGEDITYGPSVSFKSW